MPRCRLLALAFALVALSCLFSKNASAQGTYPGYAFGDPAGEVGLGLFASSSNVTYLIPQQISDWAPYVPRPYDPLSAEWSDMIGALGGAFLQVGAGFAFEAGYLAYEGAADPGILAMHQVAVEGESLLLTSGITALIKKLSGRCRPRAYRGPKEDCIECDAFPSGHTSAIAAFSGARLVRVIYTPLGAGFAIRAASLVFSDALMTTTAILRVLSGSHSFEDVIGGALIGYATGATMSLIHPNLTLAREELTPGAEGSTGVQAASLPPITPVLSWNGSF